MTLNFLTMNQAAKKTGKSASSIRRIIYPILQSKKHPDRHHIEPDEATAKALRLKGENFAWKISEELLNREVPVGSATPKSDTKQTAGADSQSAAIVDILRKQLEIKDQQIAAQNETIKSLTERVREGNVLMGTLQQHLALSDGSARKRSEVVNTETSNSSQQSQPTNEPTTEPAKKTHWLFKKIF